MIAFDRPPFGLAQRPLEWGPGQRLQYNPYALDGSARLAAGALAGQQGVCKVVDATFMPCLCLPPFHVTQLHRAGSVPTGFDATHSCTLHQPMLPPAATKCYLQACWMRWV